MIFDHSYTKSLNTKFIAVFVNKEEKEKEIQWSSMRSRAEGEESYSEGSYKRNCQLWVTSGARRMLKLGLEINGFSSIRHILHICRILKSTSSQRTSSVYSCHKIVPYGASADTIMLFLFFIMLCQALLGKRALPLSPKKWLQFSYVV